MLSPCYMATVWYPRISTRHGTQAKPSIKPFYQPVNGTGLYCTPVLVPSAAWCPNTKWSLYQVQPRVSKYWYWPDTAPKSTIKPLISLCQVSSVSAFSLSNSFGKNTQHNFFLEVGRQKKHFPKGKRFHNHWASCTSEILQLGSLVDPQGRWLVFFTLY